MNSEESDDSKRAEKRLDCAIEARQFEIDLFWRRSIFFWGFISAAFVAVAASYGGHPYLAIALTCFGLICSLCWTLLNRGSKYWYEAWEAKVQREEPTVMGKLFGQAEPIKQDVFWVRAQRYSVSKLLIVLSDFVFVLWTAILLYQLVARIPWPQVLSSWRPILVLAFVLLTLVYIALALYFGRSSTNSTSADKEGDG
jgi:hypothetical protein